MVPTLSSLALGSQHGPPSRRPRSRSVPGSRLRPGPSSRRLDERGPNKVESGRFGAFNDRANSERGSSSMDGSSSIDVKALLQIELYESFNRLTKVLAGMSTIV